jgi:hypothetical protein
VEGSAGRRKFDAILRAEPTKVPTEEPLLRAFCSMRSRNQAMLGWYLW